MGTIEREPEVIDNLTSTSTIDALSANQGKVLNERIYNDILITYNLPASPVIGNWYLAGSVDPSKSYTILGFSANNSENPPVQYSDGVIDIVRIRKTGEVEYRVASVQANAQLWIWLREI